MCFKMYLDRKCGVSQGRAGTSISATIRVPASELLVVIVSTPPPRVTQHVLQVRVDAGGGGRIYCKAVSTLTREGSSCSICSNAATTPRWSPQSRCCVTPPPVTQHLLQGLLPQISMSCNSGITWHLILATKHITSKFLILGDSLGHKTFVEVTDKGNMCTSNIFCVGWSHFVMRHLEIGWGSPIEIDNLCCCLASPLPNHVT